MKSFHSSEVGYFACSCGLRHDTYHAGIVFLAEIRSVKLNDWSFLYLILTDS